MARSPPLGHRTRQVGPLGRTLHVSPSLCIRCTTKTKSLACICGSWGRDSICMQSPDPASGVPCERTFASCSPTVGGGSRAEPVWRRKVGAPCSRTPPVMNSVRPSRRTCDWTGVHGHVGGLKCGRGLLRQGTRSVAKGSLHEGRTVRCVKRRLFWTHVPLLILFTFVGDSHTQSKCSDNELKQTASPTKNASLLSKSALPCGRAPPVAGGFQGTLV